MTTSTSGPWAALNIIAVIVISLSTLAPAARADFSLGDLNCDNTHNILDVLALVDLIVQDAPPSCPTLPVALIDDDQDGYDDASYDAGAESCTATPSACVMTGCDDPQEPGCNYHHTATQGSFDFHAYEGGGTPIGNESYALIEAIAVCTSLSECVGIAHQWYMPDDGGWQPVSTVQVIPANYGRALIKRCQ